MAKRTMRSVARNGLHIVCGSAWVSVMGFCTAWASDLDNAAGLELFEKQVRPVLVEHCYKCHSRKAEKVKGGLLLDSRDALLKGGESGPALIPEHPETSRMVEALGYSNVDLQMPPKGKLSDAEIAAVTQWIKLGAPWTEQGSTNVIAKAGGFDLETRRREHWAWQPIRRPHIPVTKESDWARGAIDQFVLAKLESTGLRPAPAADRRTLLRRLCFDLTGLPPAPGEVESFVDDPTEGAYERKVDELLASPAFGERWARHWLDLVRYAETLGHEFDYPALNAWRYRDYIIRALNEDVPYDQLVLEHVAGDLLEHPRRDPIDGHNESAIGTMFYWLGQRDHSPVDVRQHQAELIDNQIDVLTKTFLGVTVACARCHDHKFDAISTQDYYGLYSVLSSSRYSQVAIDPPESTAAKTAQLAKLKPLIRKAVAKEWHHQAEDLARYLLAARDWNAQACDAPSSDLEEFSQERNVEPVRLEQWSTALAWAATPASGEALSRWLGALLDRAAPGPRPQGTAAAQPGAALTNRVAAEPAPAGRDAPAEDVLADFTRGELPSGWFLEGEAFGKGPASIGEFVVGTARRPVRRILEASSMDSEVLSRRLQGTLRSPTFVIHKRYLHLLAAGHEARINIPVDNFTMIRDPIYGGLKRVINSERFRWITIDLEMWQGHRAYVEINDTSASDPGSETHQGGYDPAGWIALERMVASDQAAPPNSFSSVALWRGIPASGTPVSEVRATSADRGAGLAERPEALVQSCQAAVTAAVEAWGQDEGRGLSCAQAALLNELVGAELLDSGSSPEAVRLAREYAGIEASIPEPTRVPALADGTGLDEHVFVRGNHRLPGPVAPRGLLRALDANQPPIAQGSGRLEVAHRMLEASDPLLARVIVNRVWLHLFGRGIVATPDDFGVLGERPTHPELLDWLADWFRTEGGWSIKRLIRVMVSSSTYRMSSRPADSVAEAQDPDNRLWHRMPVRRLEGEAIRDAILSVAGGLNDRACGPPVPIHLTEFMDGRGRPSRSGPIDGGGRRTIYVEVRRNFVSPMMRAFDMPVPFTTVGRRTVSNVPAQSLILMNDPFVMGEARRWARHLLAEPDPGNRLRTMYLAAFSRRPSRDEEQKALEFVDWRRHAPVTGANPGSEEDAWTDLCHVLFNLKEFVFVD